MTGFVDKILNLDPTFVYIVVPLLVFAEDAIFVGFVLPGETAAVLGGVVASHGRVQLWLIVLLVVIAAIVGDSVGYEIGHRLGPRILRIRLLDKRREKLDQAQEFLRRRGGAAVFLGRFIAFFRAVMPALAGISRMRYLRFLAFNAAGGIAWGIGFVVLGYAAGDSYKRVEAAAGRGAAIAVGAVVIAALIAWEIRKHLVKRRGHQKRGGAEGERDAETSRSSASDS